ncbi:MAG: FliG C-terminal domain-containing protein [Myxococcota bacterium]
MADIAANLTGPEKAVLFLLSLEESVAAPIVGELEVADLKKLRAVAATMREVSADALDHTYAEFLERSGQAVAVPRGGLPYLRRLAAGAHGEPIAHEVFESVGDKSPLARLEAAPPEAIAALLESETPQLIGAVLARLDAATAAAVLTALPPEREIDVLSRLGRLQELPAAVLQDVARAVADELPAGDAETLISIDGVTKAADILKEVGRDPAGELLQQLEEADPDLARDMRMAMFQFEELERLDPRSMRTLLREMPTDRLTLALKGAEDPVMNAVFAGLSERAANLIRDDLEVLGKVRKADVEAAQQEVVQVALRLEADGAIDLGRGDD